MAKTRGLDRFSARIKNLYVELNDYAYFHSPSEIGRIDRRFTGRLRVLERLKSLFTDYETPSGAYLVTGYRGAGKSSLVAKALSEVSAGSGLRRRSARLLRLVLPLLPLCLLGGVFSSAWFLVPLALSCTVLLAYLMATDPRFPSLLEGAPRDEGILKQEWRAFRRLFKGYGWPTSERRFHSILRSAVWPSFVRSFLLREESSPRSRFRVLSKDLFLLGILVLAGETVLAWSAWWSSGDSSEVAPFGFWDRLWVYSKLLGLLVFANLIAWLVLERKRKREETAEGALSQLRWKEISWLLLPVALGWCLWLWNGSWLLALALLIPSYFATVAVVYVMAKVDPGPEVEGRSSRCVGPGLQVLRQLSQRVKNHLRYSNRVFIKINLSQDDIREIDILRLIAKNIFVAYKGFSQSWLIELHWKVIRISLLVLLLTVIYNFQVVFGLNCGIKNDLHLACYFPSQGSFFLEGGMADYHTTVRGLAQEHRFGADALRESLAQQRRSRFGQTFVEDFERRTIAGGLPVAPESLRAHPVVPQSRIRHLPFAHEFAPGFAGRAQQVAMGLTTYFDSFVQQLYRRGYESLPRGLRELRLGGLEAAESTDAVTASDQPATGKQLSWLSVAGIREGLALVPEGVDYLFLLYLLGLWLGIGLLLRWPALGLVNHRAVLQRLERLNDMIESRVTQEKGILPAPTGALFAINFGRRESRTSPVLNERDIEKYLLEILAMIERIPRLTVRPEFVIIFDELDKIQHQENYTLGELEEQVDPRLRDKDKEYQGREFASFEAERQRQHRILSLVSNLKHFLTTAPAKFIFIAGREMFDASLADISDRHFFMGSVFHEVLYVPSFHSDDSDNRLPDITSLTEQYLCRFLLPRRLWHRGLDLQNFGIYLREELWPDHHDEDDEGLVLGEGERLARREREKVLYELHNFITYLTYRSNGAPKKITRTMERFLVRLDGKTLGDQDNLCVGRSEKSLYLRFSYYDQYTFGLVTYLGGPLIFSLNRAIKDYGDKILVSSSFLLDHVYKFHGEGFSWRNLELLPEIVDINRAPQLRELITNILRFLAKSDIAEIVSGLYDFKFTRRITEEIAFLSKISEEESAAFNFTLDESLAIKRHFNHKLKKLLETYDDYPNAGSEKFVNSIAFVRMILGDLHFYDGELDSAIIEYMEAVQALRNVDLKTIRIDTLVLMVRNFLKLGLAFERKKSYDSAFVTYGRITSMITQIGERSRGQEGRGTRWRLDSQDRTDLHVAERIFNQTAFEGIQLIYQPMFARLQVIEKSTLGGITERDVRNVVQEFERMLSPAQTRDRYLIEGEFKNKVADILFFKNGPLPAKRKDVYCFSSGALCGPNPSWSSLVEERRRLPCLACRYYNQALGGLCRDYLGIDKGELGSSPWVRILRAFEGGRPMADRQNSLRELGGTLSDLGDTFLSCSRDQEIDEFLVITLIQFLEAPVGKRSRGLAAALDQLAEKRRGPNGSPSVPNKLEEALTCFAVASILYRWGGNSRACARELAKFLWVLRELVAIRKEGLGAQLERILETQLVPPIIRESYQSHEGTHRLEVNSLKEVLEAPGTSRLINEAVNLGRLSIAASVIESLVVLDEIRLARAPEDELLTLDHRTSPFAMFHSVFARIHSLRYRSRLHYENLKRLDVFDPDDRRSFKRLPDPVSSRAIFGLPSSGPALQGRQVLEFIISDSIYCNHEILRFLGIYGTSYMASHSMRASAHRNLSFWCDLYYNYCRCFDDLGGGGSLESFESSLRRMVGEADMVNLSPNFHAEMALSHFEAAKEAHSEGKAYSELLDKMYYLTDDFADQLEHFCAGLERFQINSGSIDTSILQLRKRLSATTIYDADRYTEAGWFAAGRTRGTSPTRRN